MPSLPWRARQDCLCPSSEASGVTDRQTACLVRVGCRLILESMDEKTVQTLLMLNRRFYDTFADAFTASRGEREPGLGRALRQVRPGARVLDLGCGHGRVAQMLPSSCAYVGVDFSEAMLARAASAGPATAQFIALDLMDPDWPQRLAGTEAYDWVILRAVLHHIPGQAHRTRLVQQAARLLAAEGTMILANWQFLDVPRLRRRVQPWARIQLRDSDVEPGDYLLDWQRGGSGLRYVHLIDEGETRHLATAAGLRLVEMYREDGHQNRLTLYAVLRASASEPALQG